MDKALFFAINNLAGNWFWLDTLAVFCADYLIWLMVVILAMLWFTRPLAPHRLAIFIAFISAIVSRYVVGYVLKYVIQRPRPFAVLQVRQLIPEVGWALPSGHATFAFGLATGIYLYNRRWGLLAYLGAILVSISRVYVGVHWPTDILAGAIVGIVTALFIHRLIHKAVHDF